MDPSVGVLLPKQGKMPRAPAVEDVGVFGRMVEDLGYESLWTTEGWGTDSFVDLARVAAETTALRIGTAIVNVFSRTPAGIAVAAASLARQSGGRFVLGLGAGHPSLIENFHDIEYTDPMRRLHETISLVRQLLDSGDPVTFDGEVFSIQDVPPLDSPVPIYTAALGRASRRLTGRLSDGWLPYHVPLQTLAEAFEPVAEAARAADRDPETIMVNPYVPAVVDQDPEQAHHKLRENIASYVGRFADDTYKGAIGIAFPDEAEEIATCWRSGDEAGAIEAVTMDLVEAVGISGTPETAREKLRDLLERPLVNTPLLAVPHGLDEHRRELTVTELAPGSL